MKKWLLDRIKYLFLPEESRWEGQWAAKMTPPGRASSTRLSFKAVFWCGMAVAVSLMLGKLA